MLAKRPPGLADRSPISRPEGRNLGFRTAATAIDDDDRAILFF